MMCHSIRKITFTGSGGPAGPIWTELQSLSSPLTTGTLCVLSNASSSVPFRSGSPKVSNVNPIRHLLLREEGRTAPVVSSKARASPAEAGTVQRVVFEKAEAQAVRKVEVEKITPLQQEAAWELEETKAGAPTVPADPFGELGPSWRKSRFHFLGPSILLLSFLDFGGVLSRIGSWFLSYPVKVP